MAAGMAFVFWLPLKLPFSPINPAKAPMAKAK